MLVLRDFVYSLSLPWSHMLVIHAHLENVLYYADFTCKHFSSGQDCYSIVISYVFFLRLNCRIGSANILPVCGASFLWVYEIFDVIWPITNISFSMPIYANKITRGIPWMQNMRPEVYVKELRESFPAYPFKVCGHPRNDHWCQCCHCVGRGASFESIERFILELYPATETIRYAPKVTGHPILFVRSWYLMKSSCSFKACSN